VDVDHRFAASPELVDPRDGLPYDAISASSS
jgi:hypothetical protein